MVRWNEAFVVSVVRSVVVVGDVGVWMVREGSRGGSRRSLERGLEEVRCRACRSRAVADCRGRELGEMHLDPGMGPRMNRRWFRCAGRESGSRSAPVPC